MAAPELPREERLRELTAQPDLTPEEANRYGDLFLDAHKYAQAMMFYERSKDPSRLERVKRDALQMGDAFLLQWIARLSPELVAEAEWKEAGERALREGKFIFARDCFERAGDLERAQAARQDWLKIYPTSSSPGPAGS